MTERTFYRYFDSKEGLLVAEATAWMDSIHSAIIARPATEPPAQAVKNAILDVTSQVNREAGARIFWVFADDPSTLKLMRRAGTRPLLRLESAIITAILDRAEPDDAVPDRFNAELIGRIAVAVLRTVASQRRRKPTTAGGPDPAADMIERGFAHVPGLFAPQPPE